MTTCLETLEQEMFCSFPQRHCDVSRKPETLSARCQTGWNVTKCPACHEKRHDNLLGNLRKREVLQLPPKTRRCPRKSNDSGRDTWMQKNEHFVRDVLQFSHFRHFIKQVGMSQSATPATQNDMTSCLETFEKEMFCGFPHRHCEATGKPETRDKTHRNIKTSISCETSGNFHSWQHDKKTSFAASPIDTARPLEHQTRETRQVGAPKRAFRARLPPIFTLCSFKIDVFLQVFLRT